MKSTNSIPLSIAAAATSGTATFALDSGKVKSIKMFSSSPANNHNNTGIVLVELKSNGKQIVDLQPIDNLRSKDVSFENDGLPIEDIGGRQIDISVSSATAFSGVTNFYFVVSYECQQ